MRFGQYSETTLSDENIVAMRQLTRFRMALVDSCGDCKRRIIDLMPRSLNLVSLRGQNSIFLNIARPIFGGLFGLSPIVRRSAIRFCRNIINRSKQEESII
jgi:hypothetical protein